MTRRTVLQIGGTSAVESLASLACRVAAGREPRLRLIRQYETPVLTKDHPDAVSTKYGFEGGRVVKLGSTYHLFTSEMAGDPIWVKMQLGYWRSGDGLRWKRMATLFASSGAFEGEDPRAALWSPGVRRNRRPLEPVLCGIPCRAQQWRPLHAELRRRDLAAVSHIAGADGIGGPYQNVGVVLKPGRDSDAWERLQGTDTFFPYRVGREWRALYGSAKTQVMPIVYWWVGLASAPAIGGPWRRVSALNPMRIESLFIENPIVEALPDGGYLCVYDSNVPDAIGYAFSADGTHWNSGHALPVQSRQKSWARDVRPSWPGSRRRQRIQRFLYRV